MKIVILDGYTENPGDLSWAEFEKLGSLTVYNRTPHEDKEIIKRIGDAKAVITNKTPINKNIFDVCPNIEYIGVLATGYNVVDVNAAKEKGIVVSNIPSYSTDSVAQLTIALLLEICHHAGEHSRSVYEGQWQNSVDFCYWNHPLIELAGKTMGIVGYGRIGQATGRIAQALGMKIIANKSRPDPALESENVHFGNLNELYANSDVIALHCPLFPATEKMINADSISKMKDGVIILNSSRGGLIDESALAEALDCGKVSGAGLDVVSSEPIKAQNPLLKAKNCIITPHIGWAAIESRSRLMDIAVENLRSFIKGYPKNVVNQ